MPRRGAWEPKPPWGSRTENKEKNTRNLLLVSAPITCQRDCVSNAELIEDIIKNNCICSFLLVKPGYRKTGHHRRGSEVLTLEPPLLTPPRQAGTPGFGPACWAMLGRSLGLSEPRL